MKKYVIKQLVFLLTMLCINQYTIAQHIKYIQFSSCDTVMIKGKLWLPSQSYHTIAIDVDPCLNVEFPPETNDSVKLRYDVMLREKLLKQGIAYFEFAGRTDSTRVYHWRYPVSTMLTKVRDLEGALNFIRSREEYKHKKIILIGQSEGGATSAIVASRDTAIHAVVLLSTPGISGKEFSKYQKKFSDTVFMRTYGWPEAFDALNQLSSLKKADYECSYDGYRKFLSETYEWAEDFILPNQSDESINQILMSKIKDRWNRENEKTKAIHKNFESYCFGFYKYFQPEQRVLYRWRPEQFFPKIKCPVVLVYGTLDKSVEYKSCIENIRTYLKSGGNDDLTVFVLKDHDHYLANPRKRPQIEEESVDQVVDRILQLQ